MRDDFTPGGSAIGDFMFRVLKTSDDMDRADADGWVVVCLDCEPPKSVVYVTGPFDTPEEALVEAGRQDATSLAHTHLREPGEAGWEFVVALIRKPSSDG